MATEAELAAALQKADAAGNSADAKVFADAIRSMRANSGPQNTIPDPGADAPDATNEAPLPTSQVQGLLKGITTPVRNLDQWAGQGLESLGINTGYKGRVQRYNDLMSNWSKQATPGTVGNIAGSIFSGVPIALATKNPWLIGGASGALESDAQDVGGVARDTVEGAAFGKVGDVGARVVGSVVAPAFRPAVNAMLAKGVRLTPGQIMGGSLHKLEDASTSLPFLGDLVTSAQNRGLGDFNKVVANEALAPLGLALPKDVAPGHESVKYVQDALGKAYDAVLPNLTVDLRAASAATKAGNANLANMVKKLTPDYRKQYGEVLQTEVLSKFDRTGKMAGTTLKEVEEVLGDEARQFRSSGNPHDRRYGEAIGELQSQIRSLAADSNPTYADALQKINAGYSNLTRLETAAAPARKGVFTPPQLQSATRKMDPSIRKRASAAGEAKMQDVAEQGNDTLARTLGETGTASRAAINALAGMALFGGGAALHMNPMAAAAFVPILAPYTRAGGAAFRAAIKRPAGVRAIRRVIERARPAATIAAGRALSPSDQPSQEQ